MQHLQILQKKYLENYKKKLINFEKDFQNFLLLSKTLDFDFLTESSSVFSSNIE
jgi:hypothetical protein